MIIDPLMGILPLISLTIGITFGLILILNLKKIKSKPYHMFFIYLNLFSTGLHQFEEYGYPGGFRNKFIEVFRVENAKALVPQLQTLEIFNTILIIVFFGFLGWIGTKIIWIGLSVLFINFSNSFFHLVYSVTKLQYFPGVISGVIFYFPLCLTALYFTIKNNDIDAKRLLISFFLGCTISFFPFLHIWLIYFLK